MLLYLHVPRYSALSPEQVQGLYEQLGEASISYISVGNDLALLEYHDRVLELEGDGTWRTAAAVVEARVA